MNSVFTKKSKSLFLLTLEEICLSDLFGGMFYMFLQDGLFVIVVETEILQETRHVELIESD